jgi:hypothetical protein
VYAFALLSQIRSWNSLQLNADMITVFKNLPIKGEYVFLNKPKPFRDVKGSFKGSLMDAGAEQSKGRRKRLSSTL